MDVILVLFAALLVVVFFVASIRAIVRWRGVRRILAVIVLLAALSHVVKVWIDLRRDAKSHNLWPFEAVIVAGGALVVLGVVALLGRRAERVK